MNTRSKIVLVSPSCLWKVECLTFWNNSNETKTLQYGLLTELPGDNVFGNGRPSMDHDNDGRLKSPQINNPSYLAFDAAVIAARISESPSPRTDSGGR